MAAPTVDRAETRTVNKTLQPLRVPRLQVVTTSEQLAEVVAAYTEFKSFVFDVETKGGSKTVALDPHRNEVFWVSLAGPGRADAIPMGHPRGEVAVPAHTRKVRVLNPARLHERKRDGGRYVKTERRKIAATFHDPPQQLHPDEVFEALRPLFFSNRRKVGHNVKFDLRSVAKYYDGQIPPPPYGDTLVAQHLINENIRDRRLDALVKRYFGFEYEQLGKNISEQPFSAAAKYSYLDAKMTWLLWQRLLPALKAEKQQKVMRLEMDVLRVVLDMEHAGVLIDVDSLTALGKQITDEIMEIEGRAWKEAGREWNLNGAQDKAWFIFDHCGHEPTSHTDTGKPSMTKASLKAAAAKDKRVADLLRYSELDKLRGTYVEGVLDRFYEDYQHLHANLKQVGTQTGRFSCAEPNLQNIPRPGDPFDDSGMTRYGRMIRDMFVAPPGYSLVVADYDQVEYRVLGHLCQDPTMMQVFLDGRDPHRMTAALILGKDYDEVTPDERQSFGKTLNFAVIYGAGDKRVAASAGVSVKQAQEFLRRYREEEYPTVWAWKEEQLRIARKNRPGYYVETYLGRRRRIGGTLFSSDDYVRFGAERQAINTIVQGTAADIMKLALIDVHEAFAGSPFKLVLTVHDELIAEAPQGEEEYCAALMKGAMENVLPEFSVPLTVEPAWGPNWSKAK